MNTNDFRYFLKLIELRNFRATARYFGVSQPTISYAIKRLEAFYGMQLIQRQRGQSMIITLAGWRLNEHLKRVVRELDLAKIDIESLDNPKVKFGIPPMIGNVYFSSLAESLKAERILSKIELVEDGSQEILEQLKKGRIDLALIGTRQPINDVALSTIPITKRTISIVVSEHDELAQLDQVDFADLANEPFVIFNSGFVHKQIFDELCATTEVYPQILQQTNDLSILKNMIAENIGISLLADVAISPFDGIKNIPLINSVPDFYISLVYRRNYQLTKVEQQLIEITKQIK